MNNRLQDQVRVLKLVVVVLLVINIVFLLSSFAGGSKKVKFDEIDVERLNIIGTHGKPVMVISNKRLIPGVMLDGKSYPREFSDGRDQYSGIIFFNEQGDEVGGLVYNGFPTSDSTFFAIEHLSFDQWKQNQVVAMQYIDNGRSKRAGLRVWDRPGNVRLKEIFDRLELRNNTPKSSLLYDSVIKEINASVARGDNGVERMFIGSLNETAQIQMKDKKGNIRAKFYVDPSGNAKIEFYDVNGNLTSSIPN